MDNWNWEAQSGTYEIFLENDTHEEVLKLSSKYNNLEMVKRAVSYGADVRVDNDYPLKQALSNGNIEMARYLMENGAGDIHGHVHCRLITDMRKDCLE